MRKEALTLGRIGILLPILVIIPFIGVLAGLAAMVLLLMSFYKFSKLYQKPVIFNGPLTAFLVQIGANFLGAIIIGAAVGFAAFSGSGTEELPSKGFTEAYNMLFSSAFALVGLAISLIGAIVAAYFLSRSLKTLAEESGVNQFKLAGNLYLIGAITCIILVGLFIAFAAWIVHIVALFTMKEHEEPVIGQEEPQSPEEPKDPAAENTP